jgi:hypothetical protein
MRFKLDENLPAHAAELLAEAGRTLNPEKSRTHQK